MVSDRASLIRKVNNADDEQDFHDQRRTERAGEQIAFL